MSLAFFFFTPSSQLVKLEDLNASQKVERVTQVTVGNALMVFHTFLHDKVEQFRCRFIEADHAGCSDRIFESLVHGSPYDGHFFQEDS